MVAAAIARALGRGGALPASQATAALAGVAAVLT